MPLIQNCNKLFERNSNITKIYNNGNVVWPVVKPRIIPSRTVPFYVENISNENETLSIKGGNAPTLTIEYSTNNSTWRTLGTTSATDLTRTIAPGERLYLRCSTDAWIGTNAYNTIQGVSKVGGNIMSLLYGDGFTGQTSFPIGSGSNFYYLFINNTRLTDAYELLLPATNPGCYEGLFSGCTSLTDAPMLPATTLAYGCYKGMFSGCTSLTDAPTLPATTLANYCCMYMFAGCTALTQAPALPFTTLAEGCYEGMFAGCTSLTQAPALPATTLADYCYAAMFAGCTSLKATPALPAITMKGWCYYQMFDGCSSLTSVTLPAIKLTHFCCYGMFGNCKSLNNVTCLARLINSDTSDFTPGWLAGVSSTGTFTKAAGVTWPRGNSGIPEGWTVLDA